MPGRRGFWVALTLFLALFAWIRFYELPRRAARGAAVPDSTFFGVPAVRVRSFTVAFQGDTTRVAREGPDWFVVAPVRAPADPVAVQSFLSRCENLPVSRPFPYRPAEASRYGLDLPSCLVTLDHADGATSRLVMGAPAPATPAFYVTVPGRDLVALLGDADAENYFRRRTDDWRLRRLLSFSPATTVAITLHRPGGEIRLERAGVRGAWRVVEPFAGLASASAVDEYLKGLSFTAARAFVAEVVTDPAGCGLDPPLLAVTVTDTAGIGRTLGLGTGLTVPGEGALVHARVTGSPTLYGAPAGYRDLALRSDLEFRDRRLLRRALTQYRSLEFQSGAERLTLRPDSAGLWRDEREAGRPHAADRSEFVTAWIVARADSIVPAGGSGDSTRDALVTLEATAGDGVVERIEVSSRRPLPGGGEAWPARVPNGEPDRSGEVFLISGDLVRPVLALLARQVGDTAPGRSPGADRPR